MKGLWLLLLLTCFGVSEAQAQLPVGTPAPSFEVKDWFNNPPGESLEELEGKVIFIELWATW